MERFHQGDDEWWCKSGGTFNVDLQRKACERMAASKDSDEGTTTRLFSFWDGNKHHESADADHGWGAYQDQLSSGSSGSGTDSSGTGTGTEENSDEWWCKHGSSWEGNPTMVAKAKAACTRLAGGSPDGGGSNAEERRLPPTTTTMLETLPPTSNWRSPPTTTVFSPTSNWRLIPTTTTYLLPTTTRPRTWPPTTTEFHLLPPTTTRWRPAWDRNANANAAPAAQAPSSDAEVIPTAAVAAGAAPTAAAGMGTAAAASTAGMVSGVAPAGRSAAPTAGVGIDSRYAAGAGPAVAAGGRMRGAAGVPPDDGALEEETSHPCGSMYQEVLSLDQDSGDCKSSGLPQCYPCDSFSTEDCASKCDQSHSCEAYSYSTSEKSCRLYRHEPENVWLVQGMRCCKRSAHLASYLP